MLKFFLSIKSYLWITGISIGVFITGSFYIPRNLDVFSEINDIPLFKWLSLNSSDLNKFIWIYILLILILLLCINTFVCSIDAVIKRSARKTLIEVLSPQVLHLAIICVLLGHLVSASSGYKQDVPMNMNDTQEIKGFDLMLKKIEFFNKPGEDSTRWRVYLSIDKKLHILELGKPSFYNGVGFFIKSAEQKKMKAMIGLIYDPGVLWEIIGAVVFVIGASGVCYMKFNEKLPFKV